MAAAERFTILDWDSRFFGFTIGAFRGPRADTDAVRELKAWCARHGVRCVYLMCDPNDNATVVTAESHGLHLTDFRMTFHRRIAAGLPEPPGPHAVRPMTAADLPRMAALAGASHRSTRFYYDGRFPTARCDEMYRVWLERSFRADSDEVLVVERDGAAAGYVTCEGGAGGHGKIGLFAVAEQLRGAGCGRALIEHALRWFAGRGIPEVTVVTQGRNVAAQRIYERCGFQVQSVALCYHYWHD